MKARRCCRGVLPGLVLILAIQTFAFEQPSSGMAGLVRSLFRSGQGGVIVAILAVLGGFGIVKAPPGTFQAYHTAGEIPARAFREHTVLKAEVIRVADGDTIRVKHTPLVDLWGLGGSSSKGAGRTRISEETMLVRLAGIDTPEVKKQGSPGQPFSDEARDYVKNRLLNRKVRVKLLRRDQYSRAVATVEYGQWPLRRNIGEDLVREGLAVVYRQSGAEYDGRLAVLEDLEAQARARRLGLWSSAKPQLPSEYKAQLRADKAAGAAKQPARAPALAPQP